MRPRDSGGTTRNIVAASLWRIVVFNAVRRLANDMATRGAYNLYGGDPGIWPSPITLGRGVGRRAGERRGPIVRGVNPGQ